MHAFGGSSLFISNCTFQNNKTDRGGVLDMDQQVTLTVSECRFSHSIAKAVAGGVVSAQNNCTFLIILKLMEVISLTMELKI